MELKRIQKAAGVSAILEGLIYIFAFIVYGGILAYPGPNASSAEELQFLSDNHQILFLLNAISYILFGILLAVLVVGIHQRLKSYAPVFSKVTSAFGIIWVGLVIASGMISNVGLSSVIEMGSTDPDNAMLVWSSISIVAEGLGGGNEIVAGIWVLLLSITVIKGNLFSKPLGLMGLLVGTAGILTIYPLEVFTEVFGLSQIIWFIWIGIAMIRKSMLTKD